MRKATLLLIALFWVLAAAGYRPDAVRIHVRFDRIDRLQEGDPVLSQAETVGRVDHLEYIKAGYFKVTLLIDDAFKSDLSEHSRFFISDSPENPGERAVVVARIRHGGTPLKSGAVVDGSDKYAVWLEQMAGDVQDGVHYLKKGADTLADEFRNLAESEKLEALREELHRLAEAMQTATEEMRRKIRQEILPQLQQEMDRLRDRLRENGREDEMAPLDEEMQRIRRV